jgi:general secretion pathway protein D
LGTYVTHIVQLKYVKPSDMVPILQPFSKLQGSITPIEANGILVLRDYAENVKRMLEMIDKIDVNVPAEFVSEVIPIKYALAGDIANALGSLGGGSGGTVSIGGSTGTTPISGLSSQRNGTGTGGFGGTTSSSSTFGGTATGNNSYSSGGSSGLTGGQTRTGANGTPAAGGGTFQSRLQAIINRASGGQQDQIQLFGQTKIIADQRSNSLLVFASRQDMATIKEIISKLDVLLSQVLIEAIIMDVDLGKSWSLGTSVAQNPQTYSPGQQIVGGGGFNNGPSFMNLLSAGTNSAGAVNWGTNILSAGSGLNYFGNIGPNWDVAVQALASENNATIIQRPRIQTSQAKPAQFFVGQTVPYITGDYNSGYGNQSSYSQLSVGVELDVTPFINPDGLVVMDINQEIDDVSGFTTVDGNSVPNTDKRTLSSEIAVRDHDTILLGGFIRTDKNSSRSGVPLLQDIPLLGALFSQRADSKTREELVVLMRPTVLETPEIAAQQTIREEQRLPGVSAAAADDAKYEEELINKERKAEEQRSKKEGKQHGFYGVSATNSYAPSLEGDDLFVPPPTAPANTNVVVPLPQ